MRFTVLAPRSRCLRPVERIVLSLNAYSLTREWTRASSANAWLPGCRAGSVEAFALPCGRFRLGMPQEEAGPMNEIPN